MLPTEQKEHPEERRIVYNVFATWKCTKAECKNAARNGFSWIALFIL